MPNTASFDAALGELRAGQKKSHFIWYVFPILAGLRSSATSARFALKGPDAALEYLRHPVLGARLVDVIDAVHDHVVNKGMALATLMADPVDAKKVVSCCTLFAPVAAVAAQEDAALTKLSTQCEAILDAAAKQGIPRCELTGIVLKTWSKTAR